MTEPQEFPEPEETRSPDATRRNIEEEGDSVSPPVEENFRHVRGAIGNVLDAISTWKKRTMKELAAKREAKELSQYDFDLNYIFQLNRAGIPLTCKDMHHKTGKQALVLTHEDLKTLGRLDFIHASGLRVLIMPKNFDPNLVFILYPHEVGDEEKDA